MQPENMTEIINIDGRSELNREKRTREQDLEPVIIGKTQVLYNVRNKMYHYLVDVSTSIVVRQVSYCIMLDTVRKVSQANRS